MKKIAILSAVNIKHMSLITLYTDILKQHDIQYDIIYMDKYNEDEYFECENKYRYVNKINPKGNKIYKMVKYCLFYPYATKIMRANKYDFIIVWNDVAIFMFADFLSRVYKGRYCLNVRDNMGYEKKSRKKRFEKVFKNSAFNTISSEGYLDFLPKGIKYIPINSLNLSILQGMTKHQSLKKGNQPIVIGFIGYVRFFERNKKMLDVFSNDDRFELHYYGSKANELKKYAEEHNINNTCFHDSFPVNETKKYLEKIDIINNLYGNDTINLQKAISIKFFHALYANIPILVCENTFVGKEAINVGIGFEVTDINEKMKDDLFNWYSKLNFEKIKLNCNDYLEEKIEQNKTFEKIALNHFK